MLNPTSQKNPTKPQTGNILPRGWDLSMWTWIKAIEDSIQTLRIELLTRINKLGGGSGGSGDSYKGVFKVEKKDDTTVTIKGYAPPSRLIHNNIIAGLSTLETTGDVDITVSGAGVVYMQLVYSSSYTVSYNFAFSLPAQIDGEMYVTLASVEFADSAIKSVTQIRHDEIHIAGRFV